MTTIDTNVDLHTLQVALPALAIEAAERAGEIERLRRLPDDFAERLLRAGAVRVLVPEHLGGLGGSFRDWWDMTITLSTADASTGWVIGQCAMYSAVVAAKLPPYRVRQLFADPLANITGAGNGAGTAIRVPGGYRVSGRWRFASGCTLASHLTGHPMLEGADDPVGVAMLASRSEVTIHETWDVVGLAGTGSHDIEFLDVFVPEDMASHPFDGKSEVSGPLSAIVQGHWWDSCVAAGVQLGIARHTLAEVWKIARAKPLTALPGSPARSTDSAVLRALQWSDGILFAHEAAMEKALSVVWEHAAQGPLPPSLRTRIATAAVTAVQESKRVVDMVFEIAGTDGLQNTHVLSRLVRDAQALPMHTVARKARLEIIGRVADGDDRFLPFI